jgi:hypothetical protein
MKISHRRLQLPSGRAACLRPNQTAICCELSVRALIALNFARGRFCRGCVFCAHLSAGPCHTNLQPCRLRLPIDQQVGGVNQGQHSTFAPWFYQQLTPAGPARGSHPTEITPGRPFVHVARRRRPAAPRVLLPHFAAALAPREPLSISIAAEPVARLGRRRLVSRNISVAY